MIVDLCIVKLFEQGSLLKLIEGHNDTIYIDVFETNGLPADLRSAQAFFHLMEFSTHDHIWSKKVLPTLDSMANTFYVDYPFTVPVTFLSEDTIGLEGHYTGQLELIDFNGQSKEPFQIEIIVDKRAK